jgi:hypothetical protein
MHTEEPEDCAEIVRLEKPKPLNLWVATLDRAPIKSDEAFDYDQRNREILFLALVLLVIWGETHLLYSCYEENRLLNETVAQKEAEKVTLIKVLPDAFFNRIKEELSPVKEQKKEPAKVEPVKPKGKGQKGKPAQSGQKEPVAGGSIFGR